MTAKGESNLRGQVVAITGAGSGIGRALALQLDHIGARLALSDVVAGDVEQTARQCRGEVRAYPLDVRDGPDVTAWADAVVADFGGVNAIVNNAGIALTGDIDRMTLADIESIMAVDFWGVVHGTKAFLPHLIAGGDGRIVNVASVFGLIGVPSQSAYNAAKFAVRGFTEALRQEMLLAGHPVRVTCVLPGGVKTNIVRNSRTVGDYQQGVLIEQFDRLLARTNPDRAAALIVRGMERNRAQVLIGADAYAIAAMVRLLGPGYQRVVLRALRTRRARRTAGDSVGSDRPDRDH